MSRKKKEKKKATIKTNKFCWSCKVYMQCTLWSILKHCWMSHRNRCHCMKSHYLLLVVEWKTRRYFTFDIVTVIFRWIFRNGKGRNESNVGIIVNANASQQLEGYLINYVYSLSSFQMQDTYSGKFMMLSMEWKSRRFSTIFFSVWTFFFFLKKMMQGKNRPIKSHDILSLWCHLTTLMWYALTANFELL